MKPTGTALAVASLFAFAISSTLAHDDAAGPRGAKLGKVQFKTTCSAEAQKQFEVGKHGCTRSIFRRPSTPSTR
jgi:hypothetical protein